MVSRLIVGRGKANSDGLKQSQREAMVDAMLYCLFADDYDDPMERQVLDRAIARFNWESETSIPDYILAASGRVHEAVGDPATEQNLLNDISNRLENWEIRFQAIQLCKILFYSDLFFSDEEVRALAQLKSAFKA